MASDRRRTTNDTRHPLSAAPSHTRKSASLLGKYETTVEERHIVPPSALQDRHHRVYEMEFNRPYPKRAKKKKTVQLWPEDEQQLVLASRRRKLERKFISSPIKADKEQSPEKLTKEIAPREHWSASEQITTNMEEDDMAPPQQQQQTKDEIMCSPKQTHYTQLESLLNTDTNHSPSAMQVTPTHSHSSGTGTPTEIVSSSDEEGNISPLSTPNKSSEGCAALPWAPFKAGCGPLQPIFEATDTKRVGHAHDESYQSLNTFLKETEDHTLKLYIDDFQESTFDRIVESLYGNTTLRTLAICRGWYPKMGNHRTPEEMECLLQAMQCLPHLHTLLLCNVRPDILQPLSQSLPRSLVKFQMHLVEGTIPDALLDALANAPHLTQVQLEARDSFDIAKLLSTSKHLQTLKVISGNFSLDHGLVQGLADQLAANQCLLALDLEPPITGGAAFALLTTALRSNTTLQSLRVTFSGDMDETHLAAVELGQLIEVNQTLRHISNHCQDTVQVTSRTTQLLLQALHSNYALREFNFFVEEPIFWVAKEALLKRNETYDASSSSDSFGQFFQESLTCAGDWTNSIRRNMDISNW
jgi:hypothetical protein